MEKALPLEAAHQARGAVFSEAMGYRLPLRYGTAGGGVVGEEYRRLRESVGVVDRSYSGLVTVTGNEATVFLDRLLSSEITALAAGDGQISSLLSPKGKVLGVFRVFRVDESEYHLVFREPVPEAFSRTIEKYAFLNEVQVIDDSAERGAFSVEGPLARDVVEALVDGELPAAGRTAYRELEWDGEQVHVTVDAASPQRVDLAIEADSASRLWEALVDAAEARGGGPVGQHAAEVVRVEDGEPLFGVDFTSDNFPNEAGYESALTYGKCYVGQEVVARMRTYGHVNRALRGLELAGDLDAEAVDVLRDAAVVGEGGEAGRITSSVVSPRCGMIALSLVHRSHWAPGTRLEVRTGAERLGEAIVKELPFSKS